MNLRFLSACCLLAMSSLALTAQAPSADAGPAAGTIVTPAATIDSELSLIESEMMGAVKAMPANKFGFAPSQAIFVPGQVTDFATVRTFAEQATHVAQANYFFATFVSGVKPDADVRAIAKLTSKDEVVAALANSFAFAHKSIATLTAANAFEVVKTPEPGLQTRSTMAMFCVAHANDHYGQMVEYLRMNGIVPPASAR